MIGLIYGQLTVLHKSSKKAGNESMYECKCACGRECTVRAGNLRVGKTRSCGCLRRSAARAVGKQNTRHGLTGTQEYHSWSAIKARCLNKNSPLYGHYGGIGIQVDPKWVGKDGFANFLRDMGRAPSNDHTVDRKDGTKGYFRDNCRWATITEQNRNRRSNVWVRYNGEVKCLVEWSEVTGLSLLILWSRIRKLRWPIHDALTVPPCKVKHSEANRLRRNARKSDDDVWQGRPPIGLIG